MILTTAEIKCREHWNVVFRDAHLRSWPAHSALISNRKPPHETARNMFKDDEAVISNAAQRHGYTMQSDSKARVIRFVKRV